MSFKILITGASGHLGSELMIDLQKTYKCEAIHRIFYLGKKKMIYLVLFQKNHLIL